MFGRKRRKHILTIWDDKDEILFHDELIALDVPEDIILHLSEEFFNDPHPCEIHRSAVLSRLFCEFEEALPLNTRMNTSTLTEVQIKSLPPHASSLGIFEEAAK